MKYLSIGDTGLRVSRLGMGVFSLRQEALADRRHDTHSASRLVLSAIDRGITLFDTADVYAGGAAETVLGEALQGHRNEIVICTKVGLRSGPLAGQAGLSRRHILWSVDESLKRLKTNWIDLYVLHSEDESVELEETLLALDSVVRSGKVRHVGFSNWSPWKVAAALEIQKAHGLAKFSHGQLQYSILIRDIEDDFTPLLSSYGLGLVVWGPLACGFLTGNYTRQDVLASVRRPLAFDMLPLNGERAFSTLGILREVALANEATPAQVAIAWLLAKQNVSSILLGMSSQAHLDENVAACGLELRAEEILALDRASPPDTRYPNWILKKLNGMKDL